MKLSGIGLGLTRIRKRRGADTTPPVITNLTHEDQDFSFDINELGTLWYLVNTAATPLTGAAIKAAVIAETPEVYGTDAVSPGGGVIAFDDTGLTAGTWYLHVAAEDASGNIMAFGEVASFVIAAAGLFTNFSEYTTGALPSDWTIRGGTGIHTRTVQADGAALGGKVYRHACTSGGSMGATTWDDIGSVADVELLIKFRSNTNAGCGYLIAARSNADATTCYTMHWLNATSHNLRRRVSGTLTTLGSQNTATSADIWYWMRFRLNGTTQKVRWWADGGGEPGTWQIETSDTNITGAGHAGLGISVVTDQGFDVDYISAAFDGDTAVGP